MISLRDCKDFRDHIIAQHDDEDWRESGWVIVVKGDEAAIAHYGHCSCYDTWDDLVESNDHHTTNELPRMRWDWTGSVAELRTIVFNDRDPFMPERTANPEDNGYDHLAACYQQAIQWFLKKEGSA